jgi:sarcosine oxidase subunit gamma
VTVERRSVVAARAADLERVGAVEAAIEVQVSLRIDPLAASLLPFGLPMSPNTWTATGSTDALWLGPDEWLLSGRMTVEQIRAALGGEACSVVDVSANRIAVDLVGSPALETLSKGCGLDLHPRLWRTGMCAQTLLARVPVILQQRDGATRIFVRPSFAGYLVDWLVRSTPPTTP